MVKSYKKSAKSAEDTPKKQLGKHGGAKQKRQKKDPNAPKRALNGYMYFSKDKREQVKAENPDAAVTSIAKLLGAQWKGMSDDEKKPYQKMAEKDKLRYEKEMKKYKMTTE